MSIECILINTFAKNEDINYIAYFSDVKILDNINTEDILYIYDSKRGCYHKVKVTQINRRRFLKKGKIGVYIRKGDKLSLNFVDESMITEQA